MPERPAVEDAAQDAHGVRFLALGDEVALPGRATIEVGLDVRLGEREQRRASVDDRAERAAVRLAEGGHPEQRAEGVAHANASRRILAARQRAGGRHAGAGAAQRRMAAA